MKVVFLATPSFALIPLQKLYSSRHEILAVITQPDRAKNRKGEYIFSPIKQQALKLYLPIYQFESIKSNIEALKNLNADIFVSCAYGQIFNQQVIDVPKHGIINIHASILPKYRGSSPVQWAIMNGESETGVTIMQTELGLDSGDILLSQKTDILEEDDTQSVLNKLSEIGANLLLSALDKIESGSINPIKQDHSNATIFPMLTKQMGKIDFNDSAINIFNKIRAIDCFTYLNGNYVKLKKAKIVDLDSEGKEGEILNDLIIQCKKGKIQILLLQPENKRVMTNREYLNGKNLL